MSVSTHHIAVAIVTLGLLAAAAGHLLAPGPPTLFIEPQTKMEFVAIEPGSFTMGSGDGEAGRNADETPRQVTLTKRFYVGRYEVTQTQWAVVMRENPSFREGCSQCPVENVDFYQVDTFITNLNAQSVSMRYRLPTEAEWEYVCRAGTTTAFSTGNGMSADQANFDRRFPYPPRTTPQSPPDQDTDEIAPRWTLPVGSYPPNRWGLHDVHGNVWEWTNDWYGPFPARAEVDPRGPESGAARVIRGGSWNFDANSCRCALRYAHAPQHKGPGVGFRLVAEPTSIR